MLLISNPACSISASVLTRISELGGQVVLCGKNFQPSGIFLPVNSQGAHSERLDLQINATVPLKRRLWSQIVKQKIRNQSAALAAFSEDTAILKSLITKIQSGDSTNVEAQAARNYWPRMLGIEFRRNSEEAINSLLNYGYAILRAAMARAIVATGLTPALSLHHSAKENPMALVDDLMEPFRPLVDVIVRRLVSWNMDFVAPETKTELASILTIDLSVDEETTTLPPVLLRCCYSYLKSLKEKSVKLDLPVFERTFKEIASSSVMERAEGA